MRTSDAIKSDPVPNRLTSKSLGSSPPVIIPFVVDVPSKAIILDPATRELNQTKVSTQ